MKQTMPDCDKYHRPVTNRFEPCELVKRAVCMPICDTDTVAMVELEHRMFGPLRPAPVDEHGYPTA